MSACVVVAIVQTCRKSVIVAESEPSTAAADATRVESCLQVRAVAVPRLGTSVAHLVASQGVVSFARRRPSRVYQAGCAISRLPFERRPSLCLLGRVNRPVSATKSG